MTSTLISRIRSSAHHYRIRSKNTSISASFNAGFLSTGTGEAATSTTKEVVPVAPFQYPKAEDLFRRITQQLSPDEVRIMNRRFREILGKPYQENENYYFWRVKKKGKKAGGTTAKEEQDAAPAKTEFDLKLVGFDSKAKIKIIKEIRAVAELGLKEAKELVESAPCTVKKGLSKELAEEMKKKLEETGAQVELV
ncbi:hypothetical protein ACA910_020737 [Epithemia clementina (nom. ined.)]